MLKTYIDEWKSYPDLGKRKLCEVAAKKVFNKISRHFKIRAYLQISAYKKGGTSYQSGVIVIGNKTSLDTIAHELAHNLERQKYGSSGHTKRFRKLMLKIVKYIRKKNYWDGIINYNIEEGFEDKIKVTEAMYKIRKQERIDERCPSRNGGVHHWYHREDTLDTINRKVINLRCMYCRQDKEEDWSNSNIDWNKKREELLSEVKQ